MAKNPRLIDMAGQRFSRWSVLEQAGNAPSGGAFWLCRCDCGVERAVMGTDLRVGKSVSCGCYKAEVTGARSRTHGESNSRLHNIWKSMRSRCDKEYGSGYENYGGRGISVCASWQEYERFRDWATANGYRDDLSIDRVDNDKGYYPQNCRWATAKTQSRNRRFVRLTSDGRPGPEVAEENGVPTRTYNVRRHAGWSVDEAATWPHHKRRQVRPRNKLGQFA